MLLLMHDILLTWNFSNQIKLIDSTFLNTLK